MDQPVTLHLSCTSSHRLKLGERQLPELPTEKCLLLLLYLAQHRGQALSRDQLAEELWEGASMEIAKNRLRTELWRLKQYFDLQGLNLADFLHCDRRQIFVHNQLPLATDTESLYAVAARISGSDFDGSLPAVQAVIKRFECGILRACYHPWAEAEKSRVQQALRDCQEHVFHVLCRHERWREAIPHGQALLHMEPLDEYLHAELMRCYISCECRGLAVRQYSHCQKLLRDELGIAPSQTIEDLYRSLLSVAPPSRAIRRVNEEEPVRQLQAGVAAQK